MKQTGDVEFKQSVLQLSVEDIRMLALNMHELTDAEGMVADDDLSKVSEELRLNQGLFAMYAKGAKTEAWEPDPSCLSDDQLWQRIRGPKTVRGQKPGTFKGWMTLVLAAAALLLLVNPWQPLRDAPLRRQKGPSPSESVFSREGCQLALKVEGAIIELDAEGLALPASRPALFLGRCLREGFLQILLRDGSTLVSFANVHVLRSNQWQELADANQKTLGLLLPAQGSLILDYGLSDHRLNPSEFDELRSFNGIVEANKTWRWVRQRQWSIDQRFVP